MKSVSICMAFYNRKQLLEKTLQSIQLTKLPKNMFEVVICDDASNEENRLTEDFLKQFPTIKFKLLTVKKEQKTWCNPSVPFNIAIQQATNDIVILQNPECIHLSDIPYYCSEHTLDNMYLSINCYASSEANMKKICDLQINSYLDINKVFEPYSTSSGNCNSQYQDNWFNHFKYRPVAYHFCSAINRKDLFDLRGFEENFGIGSSYDDDDLVERIKHKKMNIVFSNEENKVCHLWHSINMNNSLTGERLIRNQNLFEETVRDVTRYKAKLSRIK